MQQNPLFPADLVTFTEEICNVNFNFNFIFCAAPVLLLEFSTVNSLPCQILTLTESERIDTFGYI